MNTDFEESLRGLLKSVLIEVAKEVLPLVSQPVLRGDATDVSRPRILLRSNEAAEALTISERYLWTLTHAGKIPCVRIGSLVRYDPAVLREWITLPDSARMLDVEPCDSKIISTSRRRREPKSRSNSRRSPIIAKSPQAQPATTRSTSQGSRTEQQSKSQPTSEFQRRDIRWFIASRIGVDREQLPLLTNGRILEIAGIDIPTLHGWTYLNRDMPEVAIRRLEVFFASEVSSLAVTEAASDSK